MNTTTYVVIPVYNEAGVIEEVIRDIKKQGLQNILVIDDGSTDNSAALAAAAGATVLRHMLNRGKGAAVTTAIEAAILLNADSIITMDGDGQHNPHDIPALLAAIKTHDVVLGVRTFNSHVMPLSRRIANFLGNAATWLFYGLWVNDSQCGFRAYSKKAFRKMKTVNDRYEYDSEVIHELAKHKLTYTEVPVEVRYTPYSLNKQYRQSIMNGVRMIVRLLVSS